MFISLSSASVSYACAIKQSINNYHKADETNFFDWLICSMKSINEVLDNKPILFDENYEYPNPLNTVSIKFKNFDNLISHHDIVKFNNNSIKEITEKYKRRFDRLITTIQNEKNIFFIRFVKENSFLEEDEIIKFIDKIKIMNNNLNFLFILVTDNDQLKISNNLNSNINFSFLDLTKYYDDAVINETNPYFKIIKKYKCIYQIYKSDN